MNIINLRPDVLGKTAYGKLFACFLFSFLLVERPASSRAEGIQE